VISVAEWEESEYMQEMAALIIVSREEVAHIDIDEVLFLFERETKPQALARCYSLNQHPIGLFTEKKFCIVFYWRNMDYMSEQQKKLLMFHELLHIPPLGNKLIHHNVQDFREVLGVDLDWQEAGREVPDICA